MSASRSRTWPISSKLSGSVIRHLCNLHSRYLSLASLTRESALRISVGEGTDFGKVGDCLPREPACVGVGRWSVARVSDAGICIANLCWGGDRLWKSRRLSVSRAGMRWCGAVVSRPCLRRGNLLRKFQFREGTDFGKVGDCLPREPACVGVGLWSVARVSDAGICIANLCWGGDRLWKSRRLSASRAGMRWCGALVSRPRFGRVVSIVVPGTGKREKTAAIVQRENRRRTKKARLLRASFQWAMREQNPVANDPGNTGKNAQFAGPGSAVDQPVDQSDPGLDELIELWNTLDDQQRGELIEAARRLGRCGAR